VDRAKTIASRSPETLARWALLAALLPYIVWLSFGYRYHFIDNVNLFLHEAGHVLFGIFGRTAHFLGGTLGQLLFPAAFSVYFLRRRQRFEACVVGIWLCESLMYCGKYIADARVMALPLVGGHIHDWNWLLARWGLLRHAETIGGVVHVVASLGAIVLLYCAAAELTPPVRTSPRTTMAPAGAVPPLLHRRRLTKD